MIENILRALKMSLRTIGETHQELVMKALYFDPTNGAQEQEILSLIRTIRETCDDAERLLRYQDTSRL